MLKAAYERKHEAQVSFMAMLNEKGKSPESMLISLRLLFISPSIIVQALLEGLDSFDEQLDKVETSTEKRLKAMKKLTQRQNNKDLLEYLRMAD
jgi:hypothetical protein